MSAVDKPSGEFTDFKAVKKRFLALNEARLERVYGALRERQQEMLELLPLLFHTNHPMLPGFVSKEVPCGIKGYQPRRATLDLARKVSRSFRYHKFPLRKTPILAIYIMGSVGTIAYSDKSDLDIWICHDPKLSDRQQRLLQKKASAIEAWAETLSLEVHFFLVNTEQFREGSIGSLSAESSGSAQHNLLLEEFYRTGLLLIGQPPLWWMVPPEHEADYDAYVADLKAKRFVHAHDTIDFGGLAHIPAEEFFGATLWQIYKGIDSPYKSALKLLLIEAYASEYPQIHLLCQQYKEAVYEGEDDIDRIDPYLMMLDKVETYLHSQSESQRIQVARRCFYSKVDVALSKDRTAARHRWRRLLLEERAQSWDWHQADFAVMDNRDAWKVDHVTEERRQLYDALVASYRFLSDFARKYAGLSLISQRDLTILGRKLYAAFERKAGKIDQLYHGITRDLTEAQISVHEAVNKDHSNSWVLYKGSVAPAQLSQHSAIKRARSIVELIAWCFFNKLIDTQTLITLHPKVSLFSVADFKVTLGHMRDGFPEGFLDSGSMEDFANPARILHGALFVNSGLDVFTANSLGQTMASGRSNALSYGGAAKNLAQSLDFVMVSSWHEVLTFHYRGGKGLMTFLAEYFKWSPPSKGEAPPLLAIHGNNAQHGRTVAQRLEELVHDLIACYYGPEAVLEARYILAVGRGYYLLWFESDLLHYQAVEDHAALLQTLGRSCVDFNRVIFDRHTLKETVIPLIYEKNKPGFVQFFYLVEDSGAEVYVLDERGSLFHQRLSSADTAHLMNQYTRFFEAVLNRINFLMQEGQMQSAAKGLDFYRIHKLTGQRFRLERQSPAFRQPGQHYLSLQVIVDVADDGQTVFTLYLDDREFSTLEFGQGLFDAVARHIMERRRSQQDYPIYITDISMSRAVLGEEGVLKVQTGHFLSYKRRIENELNRAMQNLNS